MSSATTRYPEVGNFGDFALYCICQAGFSCRDCLAGRHNTCTDFDVKTPETYILDRNGYVVAGHLEVWQAGYACRWMCACARDNHPGAQEVLW